MVKSNSFLGEMVVNVVELFHRLEKAKLNLQALKVWYYKLQSVIIVLFS